MPMIEDGLRKNNTKTVLALQMRRVFWVLSAMVSIRLILIPVTVILHELPVMARFLAGKVKFIFKKRITSLQGMQSSY